MRKSLVVSCRACRPPAMHARQHRKRMLCGLAMRAGQAGLLLVVSLLGCGQLTQQVAVTDLSNQGEISGKVFDLSASNVYASKYVVIVGAKVYVGTFEATTDTSGAYKLSGNPAGEIAITATAEGYIPLTLAVNRRTANIYLSRTGSVSSESGSATISGTIYGLPSGVTSVGGLASSLLKTSTKLSYDSSLYKYMLTEAPDDGETYLFACYTSSEAGTSRSVYTYAKFNMGSVSKEVNLDFGTSTNFLGVNVNLPSAYKYPNININIYSGYRAVNSIYSRTSAQESTFQAGSLPALQSGDYFGLSVSASSTEEGIKIIGKYNLSGGSTVNLDLTTLPKLTSASPSDGASLSSYPIFSWEAINDDRVGYLVYIYPKGSSTAVWAGITKDNSIAVPSVISLTSGEYRWQMQVVFYSNLDLADIGPSLAQSYLEWGFVTPMRSFTYAK